MTWDDAEKPFFGHTGETEGKVEFTVKNETGNAVTIFSIKPSCGCTTLQTPAIPWTLPPDGTGSVRVAIDLRDKHGEFEKTILVESSIGTQTLLIRLFLPGMPGNDSRARNQHLASANRQAVFQGDCARCHVPPATAVTAEELFKAACAICHQAPRRASMVPDLAALPRQGRDDGYWTHNIAEGREHSLMPAFAVSHGGIWSDAQIAEVVKYLRARFDAPR